MDIIRMATIEGKNVFSCKVYTLHRKWCISEGRLCYWKDTNYNPRIATKTKQKGKANKPIINVK